MYLNRRTEFMFIRNAIIIRAHIHTNLNIKIHIHLAEADSETLLHLRCNLCGNSNEWKILIIFTKSFF